MVHENRSDNHCNWSDTWPSMLLPLVLANAQLPSLLKTHTHMPSLVSQCAAFFCCCFLEPVKQSVRQIADFVSGICLSYSVKYQKLLVNVNPSLTDCFT